MTEKYPVLPEEDDSAKYPAPVEEDDDYAKYPAAPQEDVHSAQTPPVSPSFAAAPVPQPPVQPAKSARPKQLLITVVLFLIIVGAGIALSQYPGLIDGDREATDPVRSSVSHPVSSLPKSSTSASDGKAFGNASNVAAGDYVIRTFSDGTCEITGYTGSKEYLSVPKELNGYAVTAIGNSAFSYNKTIRNISIQTGVTRIGFQAFSSCAALDIVYLPSTLTTIDDSAFSFCTALQTIRLPDSLTTIGDSAFSHCESLTSIRIPKAVTSIGDGAFNGCYAMTSYTVEFGNTRYSSLQNCLMASNNTVLLQYPVGRSDKSFTVPASVERISTNAFATAKLEFVTIPQNKTVSIDDYAFSWCLNLKEIRLPANVTSISESAFTGALEATLVVERGSYAERFAKTEGLDYAYLP